MHPPTYIRRDWRLRPRMSDHAPAFVMTSEAPRERDPIPPATPGFEHVRRIWDAVHHRWTAKILPGEIFVTRYDESMTAVLGSCISVCIRDPALRVGGMNTFMLPAEGRQGMAARFGSDAMARLINEVTKLGARRDRLKVKLFGGGKLLSADVGARSIAFAREFLRLEGLPIVVEDLGGTHPRRVMYFPNSGMSLVSRLPALDVASIANRETQYLKALARRSSHGDPELFR
jgi:chemotaxis protein CheD